MTTDLKRLTDWLRALGIEDVPHTQRNYLGHLVHVYRLMEANGCGTDACLAGLFHSIYGTEAFQGFKLPLERRPEVRALIGERAERLAYVNCAMDRASLDAAVLRATPPYRITMRDSGEIVELSAEDFDDLCRVHLFDWLEQAPRSRFGWDYRRAAYRAMAKRLGGAALTTYDRVYAEAPAASSP